MSRHVRRNVSNASDLRSKIMLISRDQLIASRPAVEVREVVRLLRHTAFTIRALAVELGVSDHVAYMFGDARLSDVFVGIERAVAEVLKRA